MSVILITGGTGLIGNRLSEMLVKQGDQVIILTRNPDKYKIALDGITYAKWDIENGYIDPSAIREADSIIHLAGAGVSERKWTESWKNEIVASRVNSSKLIAKALNEIPNKVKTIVSASAIGWYGSDNLDNSSGFDEDSPSDFSFLGNTCLLWEKSLDALKSLPIRKVYIRIGIVLSEKGGVLLEYKKLLRFKIAAIFGNGKQIVSWIQIDDLCGIFKYAIDHENVNGVYNGVAENPVSQIVLVKKFAKYICGKFYVAIRIPSFFLNLIIGEMSVELLKSTTVNNIKIKEAGFQFKYTTIDQVFK